MNRRHTRIQRLATATLAASCLALTHVGHAATVTGQVLDGTTGQPLSGVQVYADGANTGATTDAAGKFQVDLAAGEKVLALKKDGFIEQSLGKVEIAADGEKSLPNAKLYTKPADDVVMLDAFDVTEGQATKKMETVSVRLDAEKIVNVFSAEDFTKFSAGDVASALNRVAGVNVVQGQFAIIRGLEDRYSSTLFNNAAIPSPDPNSQSVQLDLFPSDVVSNLVIAKTFAGDLPGNSSGGSINISTIDYPKEMEIKVGAGTGFNENAATRFIEFQPGNPFGLETRTRDIIERDFSVSVAGRTPVKKLGGREFRYKVVASNEVDYDTKIGVQEAKEPSPARKPNPGFPFNATHRTGDLSLGILSLSNGRFELTSSTRTEQTNGYLGAGLNLDEAGNHKIDFSAFMTRKRETEVQVKENGFIPGYDLAANAVAPGDDFSRSTFDGLATSGAWIRAARENASQGPGRGHLYFTSVNESISSERERELSLFQLNGQHKIEAVEGLSFKWAANHASTAQSENAFGIRYFYEPVDIFQLPTTYPARIEDLGPGVYAANTGLTIGANQVDEKQNYGRMDADLERDIVDDVKAKLSLGGVAERAQRDVDASYLESPSVRGNSNISFSGATPSALGQNVTDRLDRTVDGTLSGMRFSTNDSRREIDALFLDSKVTLFRKFDLLGGFRFEDILIQSNNDPFNGGTVFGAPQIFPSRYLFLDRFDNPLRGERSGAAPAGTTYNDQLLGINVPTSPAGIVDLTTREQIESLINGSIEEQKWLPSAGLAYRVNSRLTLRTAFSQTVARPSFREMGYYVSVEPGSNDLTVGNPQLQLSTVESWDARAEYTWGNEGDLVAFSVFQKKIDNAIESIVIRDPGNAEGGGLYRTFFNNQSEADLKGLEFEARKDLGFIGDGIGDYFSLGGNITYIKAEVGRSAVEVARGATFFGVLPGVQESFTGLANTRRLYNQPEWIANVDLTFDNPNWGTSATLAVFAISDVLNSAGSATFAPNGQPIAYTLDRYTASFHQVDLVLSQKWGQWTFRFNVKNLTDTTRKIIYDPSQLASEVAERSYQVGRDYSISASYQF